jgi:hypothetical protein
MWTIGYTGQSPERLKKHMANQHTFDRTTIELKQSLSLSSMSIEHQQQSIDLFMDSDFVKFAKLIPTVEEARQLTGQARILVESTKPRPEIEELEETQNLFNPTPVEVAQ